MYTDPSGYQSIDYFAELSSNEYGNGGGGMDHGWGYSPMQTGGSTFGRWSLFGPGGYNPYSGLSTSYHHSNGTYYNGHGQQVTYEEVFNNLFAPYLINIDLSSSNTIEVKEGKGGVGVSFESNGRGYYVAIGYDLSIAAFIGDSWIIGGALSEGAPNLTNRVGSMDYVGYVVDGFGSAANQSAKATFKYGQRINGTVKSAVQLTKENAALMGKIAVKLNVAGGIVGGVDCTVQAIDDFSNGNYLLGAYETTKAASYTTGTIMLFTPLAPAGAAILLVTGLVDIGGDVAFYIYGRNQ